MKRFVITLCSLLAGLLSGEVMASAPRVYRTQFVSYDIRSDAEAGRSSASQMYSPVIMLPSGADASGVTYSGVLTVPEHWLDRRIRLHVEPNTGAFVLYVNGAEAGGSDDSRSGAEFDITSMVRFGANGITLHKTGGSSSPVEKNLYWEYAPVENGVWVSAQPIISIYDYAVSATRDSTGRDGVLSLDIVVRNDYRTGETVGVGYDIYTPEGKLRNYNIAEVSLPRGGVDTVRFREAVWSAGKWLWSSASPNLYRVMLYVRYGGKIVEYVPLKTGFGTSELSAGGFVRNSRPEKMLCVRYNASDRKDAERKLSALRSRGVNTVCVDFPQPAWFYDMCEARGFYVISSLNIHADAAGGNRTPDGTVANDPRYVNDFLERARSAFSRDRNRHCIVGWSLGSDSGNGYDMYKTYQWMKQADSVRPVMYCGAAGEWNSDMPMPEVLTLEQAMQLPVVKR